ncbi:hypothetical protein [Arsenicibacter rosenii]|uniref:Uncharacterized protein n=1 Tax=Arsenicibacter rosenii TaxID=1750698 RepID=A0A1S2VCK1_9BACT|nr:hypothetical protein [Arsenicibacter rosenii]OIN55658.1 hypothetical protein BLX24_28905 [Arsenicibacter rosenii]
MKLKDLFKKMALRAGIAETDANLVATIEAIPDFEVNDDTVVKPLTTNLITESEAENKPTIKTKFTAQALNGVDAVIDPVLAEFMSEEEIAQFKKEEKPTFKKLNKLSEKLKELKVSSKPADKNELNNLQKQYNDEIAKLKTQITQTIQDKDKEIDDIRKTHKRERFDDGLARKVLNRKDLVDFATQKEGRRVVADVYDTLKEIGAQFDYETGKVVQAGDPSLEFFLDNKKASIDDIINKTLADNNYVKKSDPAPKSEIVIEQEKNRQDPKSNHAVNKNLSRLKEDEE